MKETKPPARRRVGCNAKTRDARTVQRALDVLMHYQLRHAETAITMFDFPIAEASMFLVSDRFYAVYRDFYAACMKSGINHSKNGPLTTTGKGIPAWLQHISEPILNFGRLVAAPKLADDEAPQWIESVQKGALELCEAIELAKLHPSFPLRSKPH
jgi:hypothetical protein